MSADAVQMTEQKPWLFRPGQSGNPSGRGKRLPAMVAAIVKDFGGEDRVTAAGLLLVEQACRLKIKAERAKDANDAVRLANASARLLSKVERRPQPEPEPPSLAEMRQRHGIAP